ncbi:MAG: S-layer homology domain-containing protein [Deltaproteobacteria bacterium]
MFKRKLLVILIAIVLLLIFNFSASAQYVDVPENSACYYAIASLSKAGIIGGYSDGTFKPNGNVTRAEFAKMAVAAIGKKDQAELVKNSSAFFDVPQKHWAAGYINIAVKNKIITGYADGSFKPEEKINFAQVTTILLRMLGYSSSEMVGVWPQNYIEKAKSLEITKDIKLNPNDKVSRANIAVMFERTLNTKKNASNQTLGEQSSLGTQKTCIITNSWDLDSSVTKGFIKTDIGDFKAESINGALYLGKKVNLLVDSDNEVLSAQSVEQDSHIVMVESISGNKVVYIDKNGSGSVDIPDDMVFYYGGGKSTFKNVKKNIYIGSVIALAFTEGSSSIYEYGVLIDPPTNEPVVVKDTVSSNGVKIGNINISDKNYYTVIKNGEKVSFADIQSYDVVYQVKYLFKTGKGILLVYDDKITGTYDNAYPSKASVSSIEILGEEKQIETSYAAAKLNESEGAFKIGDDITVLTGKSGKIVDVITPCASDISNYAIILSTRSGISTDTDSKGETVFYVKLYRVDGTIKEYETDDDQSYRNGSLVTLDIRDEKAHLTTVVCSPVSGRINLSDKMVGSLKLSQDAVILDVQNNHSSDDIQVTRVKWQDMPSGELTKDKVIHAVMGGGFDDIQLLVLNKYTEYGQYGILVSQTKRETASSYTVLINGQQVSFNNSDAIFNSLVKDVVYLEKDQNGLQKMVTINSKTYSNEIQALDSRRIKVNDTIYKLASDVQVYDVSGSTPLAVSLNTLISGYSIKGMSLYAGTKESSKDLIKIITITK